jgi:SSS family transporter
MQVLAVFGPLDWGIVGVYFALVIAVSFAVARKDKTGGAAGEYFLGGRSMPTWAVAVSLVATMLSSATFVGVPDIAYNGDLTYLILNLGGIIAVFFVALVFVPVLYRAGTVTIYGFLAQRFGEDARLAVSCAFIFGRLLSSAARLFAAAIPLAQLIFHVGVPSLPQLLVAIVLIGVVGTFYATVGGVRAVVWVDTIQFTLVIGTALLTIGILLNRIPMPVSEMIDALRHPSPPLPTGASKLRILDFSLDPAAANTFWTAIFGNTFLMVAAFGCDHDLAQRFLITKSAKRGAFSIIAAQFIGIAVVSLFLVIGLLLYLFYKDAPTSGPATAALSVYPRFLLNELPTGLAGVAIVGFFAIAQGSLDSAMNALAASIMADVYVPLRKRLRPYAPEVAARSSKLTVAAVGLGMSAMAMLCAALYDPRGALINFVLGLMTFALSGMLAVFLTALLTRRGNSGTVIAALVTGFFVIAVLHDRVLPVWTKAVFGHSAVLAWPWQMALATTVAFLVCVAGNRKERVVEAEEVPAVQEGR